MLMPIAHGGHSVSGGITLEITSSASEVNILTLAQAVGYSASDDTAITVNINSGVTLSASSGPALRTGGLNAASNLTINMLSGSLIQGFTGSTGTAGAGQVGGDGGDAILFEIGSGSATYEVNVNSSATLGGGSGGGGSGGSGGHGQRSSTCYDDGKGACQCSNPQVYGPYGANGASGAAGALGLAQTGGTGATGSAGSNSRNAAAFHPSGANHSCGVNMAAAAGQPGSAGGSPGKAIEFSGLSVTVSNSGTIHGATS